MKTYFKPTLVATALALAGASGTASALPLDQLYFQQTSTYVTGTADSVIWNGDDLGLTLTESSDQLAWSDGDGNTSSLSLVSYNSDNTSSNPGDLLEWQQGDLWIIDDLIQANETLNVNSGVPVPNPLWIADITGRFQVWTDAVGGSSEVIDDTTNTRIAYYETLNTGTSTDCPGGNPAGGAPCSDSYTVFEIDLSPLGFTFGDYQYFIDFDLVPGTGVTICTGFEVSGPCTVSGASPTGSEILKVWAQELESTKISVAASWRVQQISVPEPSILGLFGAVLAGLGFTARRRSKLQKS